MYLFQLGQRTLDVEGWSGFARILALEEPGERILVVLEIEGLTETKSEDLGILVSFEHRATVGLVYEGRREGLFSDERERCEGQTQ
jgi:hypothetical protein